MSRIRLTRKKFLEYPYGRVFSDVANDPEQPFDLVLQFFDNRERQCRMEDAEIHHDRPPLAGVIRELEAQPVIHDFLSGVDRRRNTRFRQAVGVLVRMILEQKGWRKTGRKGSLGVRATPSSRKPAHNSGGLAFWFVRAERYEKIDGMPFLSVRKRVEMLESAKKTKSRRTSSHGRRSSKT